jgi:signal transduction histidine kinase
MSHAGQQEKRLLGIGFGILVTLILTIGVISTIQIQSLSHTVQVLGQRYLPIEQAILGMKTNNALFAMGVRNYVYWQTSKYLQAASTASNPESITESISRFRKSLADYDKLTHSSTHDLWINQLRRSSYEIEEKGEEIMAQAGAREPDKIHIQKLLMGFENQPYQIDELLSKTLTAHNLKDIDTQLIRADQRSRISLGILGFSLLVSVLLGLWIAGFVYRRLRVERVLREQLAQRMINVEEEERKNLSHQLHDQLSQSLSALKIYLGVIDQAVPQDNTEAKKRIEKSKEILGDLVTRGHNISELLRPSELDQLGLVESVAVLASEHQEVTGCQFYFEKPKDLPTLSSEHTLVLYRVVQEALTNIAKHAESKAVQISLKQDNHSVKLSISDDGIGFDYTGLLKRPRRRKDDTLKLGLLGLRERIELLGGTFSIDSQSGRGTTIQVELFTHELKKGK